MKTSGKIGMIVLSVLGALFIAGFSFYGYVNGLRSESIRHETALNAQYLANQNFLSAFISEFYEQMGVAATKSEKLNAILSDAVKGRYDDGGFSADGAFFAAVVEAYPQLGDLQIYDRIVDYVVSRREEYRLIQEKLLDMLRAYDTWRQDGLVQSRIISGLLEIPSERLEARIGEDVVTGEAARERMYKIVLASQAKKAYETGEMEPLAVPPTKPVVVEAN